MFLAVLLCLCFLAASHAHNEIFVSRTLVDVSWYSASSNASLASNSLYWLEWEDALQEHLVSLLKEYTFQEDSYDQIVLSSHVSVLQNDIDESSTETVSSLLVIEYLAHEAFEPTVAVLLEELLQQDDDKVESPLTSLLQFQELIPEEAQFVRTEFRQVAAMSLYILPVTSNKKDQGLVVACTFLVIALVFVSCVLVWVAGGFPVILDKIKSWLYFLSAASHEDLFRKRTTDEEEESEEDDDDATNASGILGAVPSYDGDEQYMPAGFTPRRNVFRNQDCDNSEILESPCSTVLTESHTVPLGIASQQQSQHYSVGLYNKDDDDEEE